MVTKRFTGYDIQGQDFARTREFLAQFGIAPQSIDEDSEDDVLRAIHHKGWETSLTEVANPPGWEATIEEWRTLTQSQAVIAFDQDRMMALLRALERALMWPTPEEVIRSFDEQTRALLGLSAKDFYEKWRNNELPADDPRVVHLVVMRPIGW
jgi:hypothetical protein